ncbi:uncharacterized protein TM35_000153030 [Trypanosoma theileri]|uniref:AAA+ ATPase domain-containing protein n=1 Tax=Trypanosoma theileri TaxID=67003 RepID=A0A1X0NW12_9TRYP|nr:uncharacterized protein TM35_000153030 [Trypanosoma theileri]ORC88872.1 hypothetical protein TM35_000153030 [Trypanosoma theileri]
MHASAHVNTIFALLVVVLALTIWAIDVDLNPWGNDDCVEKPLCSSQHTFFGIIKCSLYRYPVSVERIDYKNMILARFKRLSRHYLKGQEHVIEGVIKDISVKLENPDKPLVLHFAGDNGVGKTTLAQLISLALGLRCSDLACTVGDSSLVLSGVSYDGFSVAEFRRDVVQKIVQHATLFPKNGVVIINDLGALHPDLVRVLLPLLGRASSFPEAPSVLLSSLTVIITTDFGRQGRTQGKSLTEMRRIVEDDFKNLYSQLSSSMIRTYPFLPTSLETAREIVQLTIHNFKCRNKDVINDIQANEDVVSWFIDLVRDDLPMENGRCVANAVEAAVGPGVLDHLREKITESMSLHVDLDDDGTVNVFRVH